MGLYADINWGDGTPQTVITINSPESGGNYFNLMIMPDGELGFGVYGTHSYPQGFTGAGFSITIGDADPTGFLAVAGYGSLTAERGTVGIVPNDGSGSGDGYITCGGAVTIDAGTTFIVNGSLTAGSLTAGSGSVVEVNGGTLTVNGALAGSGASFDISNAGTLTTAGTATISGGSLTIGSGGTLTNDGLFYNTATVNNSGTIINNDYFDSDSAGAEFNNSGTVDNQSGCDLFVIYGATMTNATGGVVNDAGTLAVYQGGTLTNNGAMTVTGLLAIDTGPFTNNGTLNLSGGQLAGYSPVVGDGHVTMTGGTLFFESDASTPTSYAGNITGSGVIIDANSASLTLSGNITGAIEVAQLSSTGALTLTGNNDFTSYLAVAGSAATVLGSANALGGGSLALYSGCVLDLNGYNATVTNFWSNGGVITDNSSAPGTTTFTVDDPSTIYIGCSIRGGSNGRKVALVQETGTLILYGSSSYTGGTVLENGNIVLANSSALGASSGSLIVNGGTLYMNGYNLAVGSLSGSGGTIVDYSLSAVTLTVEQSTDTTYCGNIQDGIGYLGLVLSGGGTLTLAGAENILSGESQIASGSTLIVGPGASLTIGNGGSMANDGTFINNGTFQIGNGTTNGSVTGSIVDNAILDFVLNSAATVNTAISGNSAAQIVNNGAGDLTLTGLDAYYGSLGSGIGT
jgi:hypothetical protein